MGELDFFEQFLTSWIFLKLPQADNVNFNWYQMDGPTHDRYGVSVLTHTMKGRCEIERLDLSTELNDSWYLTGDVVLRSFIEDMNRLYSNTTNIEVGIYQFMLTPTLVTVDTHRTVRSVLYRIAPKIFNRIDKINGINKPKQFKLNGSK